MAESRTPGPSLVAQLAQQLLADPGPMVEELLEDIQAAEPVYRGEVAPELDETIRDNLVSALTDLAREREPTTTYPRRTARRRAEQGVPLEAVLHAYGLAFRTIWGHMVRLTLAHRPDDLPELVLGGTVVWDAIDAYAVEVASEYRQRVAQLSRRREQQRMRLVGELLEGRRSTWAEVADAAGMLDLPHDGDFVVIVADTASGTVHSVPDLEEHLLGNHVASAWTPRADGVAGIVAITDDRPLERLTALLAEIADGRVGVSPTVDGLGAVDDGLPLATVARDSLARGRRGLATFDGRPVAALAAGSPPAVAARVVETVLGGLLALPDEERDLLLETLQAWFDHGGSTAAAGRALFCHRNTIRNRLNRVDEVTGRSVQDPRHVAELRVALLARHLVAPPPSDQA